MRAKIWKERRINLMKDKNKTVMIYECSSQRGKETKKRLEKINQLIEKRKKV